MKKFLILITILSIILMAASTFSQERYDYSKVKRLHWANPNATPTTYEEYLGKSNFAQFANRIQHYASASREDTTSICIVVNEDLYPQIQVKLTTYISDLEIDGYNVYLYTMENDNDVVAFRDFLAGEWDQKSIVGAVLIGDLPVPWYEMNVWEYEEFPSDLYFMDLDGTWDDANGNGKFDDHSGSLQADIWVGRLWASSMSYHDMTEVDAINNYFDKNHNYRTGDFRLEDHALAFIDDDWWTSGWEDIVRQAYPQTDDWVNPSLTTRMEYVNRVKKYSDHQYESMLLCAHSWPQGHSFTQSGNGYFYSNEVEGLHVQVLFYNLFNCSGLRFIEDDCIGSWYTLQTEYGLLAVGSSKTGSMLVFEDYYPLIGQGWSHGDAFLAWAQQNMESGAGSTDESRAWFYGMAIMGDPTLKASRFHNYFTAHVEGQIFDDLTGENIPGSVTDNLTDYSIQTNENGQFSMDMATGERTFTAESFGYYPSETEMMMVDDTEIVYIDFNLTPLPTGSLSGIVTDGATGRALSDVEIVLLDTPVPPVFTDGTGHYSLPQIPSDREYQIQLSHEDYDVIVQEIFIPADGVMEVNVGLNWIQRFEETNGEFIDEHDWQWGTPSEDGGPSSVFSGEKCWGTNLDGEYSDLTDQYLTTSQYTIGDAQNAGIKFHHWYEIESLWDGGHVQVKVNDDEWQLINPNGYYPTNAVVALTGQPGYSGDSDGWETAIFDLGDVVSNGDDVQFRFRLASTNSQQRGWFIDDFVVSGHVIEVSDIDTPNLSIVPSVLKLEQNYPNPFNPETVIQFEVPHQQVINLSIYDTSGKLINTMVDGQVEPGYHSVSWNGKDDSGQGVPSGLYFYRIKAEDSCQTKQCLLLK